jgi:hypothetical protein
MAPDSEGIDECLSEANVNAAHDASMESIRPSAQSMHWARCECCRCQGQELQVENANAERRKA